MEITEHWKPSGELDPVKAFTSNEEAIEHIHTVVANEIPKKLSRFTSMVNELYVAIDSDYFRMIGRIPSGDSAISVLPNGKLLVLTTKTSARRGKIYIRMGYEYDPLFKKSGPSKDITEYWRSDNEVRRETSFLQWKDAIAYIRREAEYLRSSDVSEATSLRLLQIKNTCRAVEHDYFKLIGRNVKTNVRGPDAARGPLPTTGKIVAVLPEGKGLAVSEMIPAGNGKTPRRFGFFVGRTRMAQIIRDRKRK